MNRLKIIVLIVVNLCALQLVAERRGKFDFNNDSSMQDKLNLKKEVQQFRQNFKKEMERVCKQKKMLAETPTNKKVDPEMIVTLQEQVRQKEYELWQDFDYLMRRIENSLD